MATFYLYLWRQRVDIHHILSRDLANEVQTVHRKGDPAHKVVIPPVWAALKEAKLFT